MAAADCNKILEQLHSQVDSWDAVKDELLLRTLQTLRDNILRRATTTEQRLDASAKRVQGLSLNLRKAACNLEVLAQSQFLEHRVEENEMAWPEAQSSEDLWFSSEFQPTHEAEIYAIRRALDLGQQHIESEKSPQAWMPLPPIVGSEAFWQTLEQGQEQVNLGGDSEDSQQAAEIAQIEEYLEDEEKGEEAEVQHEDTKDASSPATDLMDSLNALLTSKQDVSSSQPLLGPLQSVHGVKGKAPAAIQSERSLFDDDEENVSVAIGSTRSAGDAFNAPLGASDPSSAGLSDTNRPGKLTSEAKAAAASSVGALFGSNATTPSPPKRSSPAKGQVPASLFDEESAKPQASQKHPQSSLFDDNPSPPQNQQKQKLQASLFDDDTDFLPRPRTSPPAPSTAPGTSQTHDPLFDDEDKPIGGHAAPGKQERPDPLRKPVIEDRKPAKSKSASLFDDDDDLPVLPVSGSGSAGNARARTTVEPLRGQGVALLAAVTDPQSSISSAAPLDAVSRELDKPSSTLLRSDPLNAAGRDQPIRHVPASSRASLFADESVSGLHQTSSKSVTSLFDDEGAAQHRAASTAAAPHADILKRSTKEGVPSSSQGLSRVADSLFGDEEGPRPHAAMTIPAPGADTVQRESDEGFLGSRQGLSRAVGSLFGDEGAARPIFAPTAPVPTAGATGRQSKTSQAQASLFGDKPQILSSAGVSESFFGEKPPLKPNSMTATAASPFESAAVSQLQPSQCASESSQKAPPQSIDSRASTQQQLQPSTSDTRPSLFGGGASRRAMASIFDDDDDESFSVKPRGKSIATLLADESTAATPPALRLAEDLAEPQSAAQLPDSQQPEARKVQQSASQAEAVQTSSKPSQASIVQPLATPSPLASTAQSRLAALRGRTSTVDSGSSDDEQMGLKPAVQPTSILPKEGSPAKSNSLFEQPVDDAGKVQQSSGLFGSQQAHGGSSLFGGSEVTFKPLQPEPSGLSAVGRLAAKHRKSSLDSASEDEDDGRRQEDQPVPSTAVKLVTSSTTSPEPSSAAVPLNPALAAQQDESRPVQAGLEGKSSFAPQPTSQPSEPAPFAEPADSSLRPALASLDSTEHGFFSSSASTSRGGSLFGGSVQTRRATQNIFGDSEDEDESMDFVAKAAKPRTSLGSMLQSEPVSRTATSQPPALSTAKATASTSAASSDPLRAILSKKDNAVDNLSSAESSLPKDERLDPLGLRLKPQ
eukprot:TRINITY_DN7250_c0_g1_i1.p1 TRINITY_DN7250_c0_g1~~TRINITY_DN7250_c0_g1_i1.p1  ORF type:complete len:1218 (+),score=255.31 TRINITY_DN7250_c0_g1_i1:68-3721(+)